VNGAKGRLKSPEQTNVHRLYQSFKDLPPEYQHPLIYKHDPHDNFDWWWPTRLIAHLTNSCMTWALEDAYKSILKASIGLSQQLREHGIEAAQIHFRLFGGKAGATLIRRLVNLMNERLIQDLHNRGVTNIKGFHFPNVVMFDCSYTASVEKPLDRYFNEDIMKKAVAKQPSASFRKNVTHILHFVAMDEPEPNNSPLLVDRYKLRDNPHATAEEIWLGGDSDDICSQPEELTIALDTLNVAFGDQLKVPDVRLAAYSQRVYSDRGSRAVRVLDGEATGQPPVVVWSTLRQGHLERFTRLNMQPQAYVSPRRETGREGFCLGQNALHVGGMYQAPQHGLRQYEAAMALAGGLTPDDQNPNNIRYT
jgi:hypothetical protein